LHGLSGNRQATIEQDEERISVRHGDQSLELKRNGSTMSWQRQDGRSGTLELTEAGTLRSSDSRSQNRDLGHPDEKEMDMAAEAWARELMQ